MVTGIKQIDRRAAVFELSIVVPDIFARAFLFYKEVGAPEEKIVTKMIRYLGLLVGVKKPVLNHAHVHVPVEHWVWSNVSGPAFFCY